MRVLVADDHALLRTGLIHLLRQLHGDLTAFEAADAAAALDAVHAHPDLDLILLDLFIPGANGFELLTQVCRFATGTPVVVLSSSEERGHMRKALDCGAVGFIPKSAVPEVMLSALRLVLEGGEYVPPDLLEGPSYTASQANAALLTARQRDVLRLVGQGQSNKQIARVLNLSENTVKIHVASILRSLGAANRTEAVMLARQQGFDFTL